MQIPDIIVAIDGFSSTGKSTLARLIAKEYSLLYLDSGALYRAVTLHAMENGMIDGNGDIDEKKLHESLGREKISFGPEGTYIGDRCVEKEIRTMGVSSHVSPVSAIPFVREYVDSLLHEFLKLLIGEPDCDGKHEEIVLCRIQPPAIRISHGLGEEGPFTLGSLACKGKPEGFFIFDKVILPLLVYLEVPLHPVGEQISRAVLIPLFQVIAVQINSFI